MAGRILIVEDEAGLVTTLRDRLRKQGYTVSVARDAESALETTARHSFDLILLDLMLPGAKRIGRLREIAQRRIEHSHPHAHRAAPDQG